MLGADHHADAHRLEDVVQRLADLLSQLVTEQGEFETQLWQLDRQVDAIARNERMINLLEKRQKTIDKYDRYTADSVGEVQTKIARLLAAQEGRIAALGTQTEETDYVEQAEAELDLMVRTGRSFLETIEVEEHEPEVVEIGPETGPESGMRMLGRLD